MAVGATSRGRLTLRSADPGRPPVIDPGYLAEQADLEILVAGVRQARAIAACAPLAGLIAGEHAPGESMQDDAGLRRVDPRQRDDGVPSGVHVCDGRR